MHEGIPSKVITAIANALAVSHLGVGGAPRRAAPRPAAQTHADLGVVPLAGGTNRRTYHVQCEEAHWVARVERAPAPSLARAVDAQTRAPRWASHLG